MKTNYLQKFEEKKIFLVGILSATDVKAGSGSGSVSQWYGSADPDLNQNVRNQTLPVNIVINDLKWKNYVMSLHDVPIRFIQTKMYR